MHADTWNKYRQSSYAIRSVQRNASPYRTNSNRNETNAVCTNYQLYCGCYIHRSSALPLETFCILNSRRSLRYHLRGWYETDFGHEEDIPAAVFTQAFGIKSRAPLHRPSWVFTFSSHFLCPYPNDHIRKRTSLHFHPSTGTTCPLLQYQLDSYHILPTTDGVQTARPNQGMAANPANVDDAVGEGSAAVPAVTDPSPSGSTGAGQEASLHNPAAQALDALAPSSNSKKRDAAAAGLDTDEDSTSEDSATEGARPSGGNPSRENEIPCVRCFLYSNKSGKEQHKCLPVTTASGQYRTF